MNFKTTSIKLLFIFFVSFGLLYSCKDEEVLNVIDSQEYVDSEYATIAKNWYDSNRKLSKNNELNFSTLNVEWTDYKVSPLGSKNKLITVPISSKKDKFYREIAIILSENNPPFGVIKEYTGDPFKENTFLNIYSGSGRHLESAIYNKEDGTMQYISRLKSSKSLKSSMRKIANASGNFKDGFEIEEVVVTGYQPPRDYVYIPPIEYPTYDNPDYNYSFPAPPSGGGGGSSSTTQVNVLSTIPSKDPCAGRASVNERLNKSDVKKQVNEASTKTKSTPINGKNVEYGFETVLTNKSVKQYKNNPIKSGTESNVSLTTSWDATKGYTVGYTHVHPKNGAPSPSDLFIGSHQAKDWSTYNLPASDKSIFIDYFTSTVITDNEIYVITIKDATKWEQKLDLQNSSARAAANAEYLRLANEYMEINQKYKDTVGAQLYALLNMYGDTVNIYRANRNESTLDFKVLELVLNSALDKRC